MFLFQFYLFAWFDLVPIHINSRPMRKWIQSNHVRTATHTKSHNRTMTHPHKWIKQIPIYSFLFSFDLILIANMHKPVCATVQSEVISREQTIDRISVVKSNVFKIKAMKVRWERFVYANLKELCEYARTELRERAARTHMSATLYTTVRKHFLWCVCVCVRLYCIVVLSSRWVSWLTCTQLMLANWQISNIHCVYKYVLFGWQRIFGRSFVLWNLLHRKLLHE